MKQTNIPLGNIYQMLCYAWETFPSFRVSELATMSFDNTDSLYAHLLSAAYKNIKQRGLLKSYLEVPEDSRSLRGKLDISDSVKRMLFKKGQASCLVSELSTNSVENQIVKWALSTVLKHSALDKQLRQELRSHAQELSNISTILPTKRSFKQIVNHSGNRHYQFILGICELIFDLMIPDESCPGSYRINEVFRDEKIMSRLFESFVRNFYKREQTEYTSVRVEEMRWEAKGSVIALEYLPVMRTDITLESPHRCVIVDTKFYANMFDRRFDKEKIKANNLYQLISYLRTKSSRTVLPLSGVLLYPENGLCTQLDYLIEGFPLSVASIDLTLPWNDLKERLLTILLRENSALDSKLEAV